MNCIMPFTDVDIMPGLKAGEHQVRPCCLFRGGEVITDCTLHGLFNAPLLRATRKELIETGACATCMEQCRDVSNLCRGEIVGRKTMSILSPGKSLWAMWDHGRGPSAAFVENLGLLRESVGRDQEVFASPINVRLLMDYDCNRACHFCWQRRARSYGFSLTPAVLGSVLAKASTIGIISLIGGEPFFSKRCLSFLDACRKLPPVFEISSNCSMLPDWLEELQFFLFCCTICAVRKETFENVHIGADYQKTMDNFERLRKVRDAGGIYGLYVNFNLSARNLCDLVAAIEFFASRSVEVRVRAATGLAIDDIFRSEYPGKQTKIDTVAQAEKIAPEGNTKKSLRQILEELQK